MTQSPATVLRAAIATPIAQFAAAFSRGDAAGAATVYTADAQVLPPNSEVVSGKQAIQTFWQGAMDMGIKTVTLETVEVEGFGNTAYEADVHPLIYGTHACIFESYRPVQLRVCSH